MHERKLPGRYFCGKLEQKNLVLCCLLHLSANIGDRVAQTRRKTRFETSSNNVLDHYLKALGHITNTYIDDNQ